MAQPIHIRITEEGVGTNLQGTNMNAVSSRFNAASSANIVAKSVYTTMLVNAGVNAVKTAFMAQAQLYGDTTGDYIGQSKIDNTFQLAGNLLNIGSAIGAGAMTGGPVGAVAAAVVSVGSLALNEYNEYRKIDLDIRKQNASARFNSSQIGDILINGNRGR